MAMSPLCEYYSSMVLIPRAPVVGGSVYASVAKATVNAKGVDTMGAKDVA